MSQTITHNNSLSKIDASASQSAQIISAYGSRPQTLNSIPANPNYFQQQQQQQQSQQQQQQHEYHQQPIPNDPYNHHIYPQSHQHIPSGIVQPQFSDQHGIQSQNYNNNQYVRSSMRNSGAASIFNTINNNSTHPGSTFPYGQMSSINHISKPTTQEFQNMLHFQPTAAANDFMQSNSYDINNNNNNNNTFPINHTNTMTYDVYGNPEPIQIHHKPTVFNSNFKKSQNKFKSMQKQRVVSADSRKFHTNLKNKNHKLNSKHLNHPKTAYSKTIHVNNDEYKPSLEFSKKHRKISYKPYTLRDFQNLPHRTRRPQSLEPDLEDESIRSLVRVKEKIKAYSDAVMLKNKKHRPRNKAIIVKPKSKTEIAKEYAKAVQKLRRSNDSIIDGKMTMLSPNDPNYDSRNGNIKRGNLHLQPSNINNIDNLKIEHFSHPYTKMSQNRNNHLHMSNQDPEKVAIHARKKENNKIHELQAIHQRNRQIAQNILLGKNDQMFLQSHRSIMDTTKTFNKTNTNQHNYTNQTSSRLNYNFNHHFNPTITQSRNSSIMHSPAAAAAAMPSSINGINNNFAVHSNINNNNSYRYNANITAQRFANAKSPKYIQYSGSPNSNAVSLRF